MSLPRELIEGWIGNSTPGAVYVHFDAVRVLHEHYAGLADLATQRPVDARTSFHGFSVTKTMTALAVMRLVEEGRMELDAPARSYLPAFPYAGEIRVRHLLTHTAGLPNPLPLAWVHAPEVHTHFDRDAFFAAVLSQHTKLRSIAGDRFAYSNLGYVLLGQIIERVTGQRYEEVIRRTVFGPSGIVGHELGFDLPPDGAHATGYLRTPSLLSLLLPWMVDAKRLLNGRVGHWRAFRPFLLNGAAYGGSLGTAAGYRKYLQALLTDGALIGKVEREMLFTEARTNDGRGTGMAFSWFTGTLNGIRYRAHAGGGGGYYAELRIYPDHGRGSVLLLNRTGVRDERLLDRLDAQF